MLPIVRIRRKYTTNPSAVATRAFTSKAASEAVEGADFSGASTKKQSGTSTTAAAVNGAYGRRQRSQDNGRLPERSPAKSGERACAGNQYNADQSNDHAEQPTNRQRLMPCPQQANQTNK